MADLLSSTTVAHGRQLFPHSRSTRHAPRVLWTSARPKWHRGVCLQDLRSRLFHTGVINCMKNRVPFRHAQPPLEENMMRILAGAASAPVAQYVSSPVTWLHSLDPRVKQAWLFVLVLLPSNSHIIIRSTLVAFLVFATAWTLPRQMWQDQLRRMVLLSAIVAVTMIVGTDGAPPPVCVRGLPPALEGLPKLPSSHCGYSYMLLKMGPLHLTRKGLKLAFSASCLSFIVLQSATLCLTTTSPEQLAAALRWYMQLLTRVRIPVDELILTLLLSLRFMGLVFDEVRNLALAVVSRGMQFRRRTLMDAIDTVLTVFGRLFKNLFSHSEQISEAMIARGYKGVAAAHEVYNSRDFDLRAADISAILLLLIILGIAMIVEFVV